MWKKILTLNLSQQKEEETNCCQNQIIIQQKFFIENLLAKEMKMQILINKPAYLGILILQLSKTLMYEF